MLFNVSYNNPEIKREINHVVGKAFSFRERWKFRGIGLGHLLITDASEEIQKLLDLDKYRNKCNIELRPRGIIIGFRALLESYALVIPYWKLNLFKGKSEEYSFHKDQFFIIIEARGTDTRIHKFVKRILNEKTKQTLPTVDTL